MVHSPRYIILGYRTSLNKSKRIEMIQSMSSYHKSEMKTNNRKKFMNLTDM